LGHLMLLWSGLRMALVLSQQTTQHASRALLEVANFAEFYSTHSGE
jgi:hypothetical protein